MVNGPQSKVERSKANAETLRTQRSAERKIPKFIVLLKEIRD
jgi:hypothetical protein